VLVLEVDGQVSISAWSPRARPGERGRFDPLRTGATTFAEASRRPRRKSRPAPCQTRAPDGLLEPMNASQFRLSPERPALNHTALVFLRGSAATSKSSMGSVMT